MGPSLELELKFEAAAEDLERAAALFPEVAFVESRLVSTYFDTPDKAIGRAGCTLRVRLGGGGRKQTFKREAAGQPSGRDEWEAPSSSEPDVGFLAATPAGALIEGRPVLPLFEVRNRRRSGLLKLAQGVVELALDDAVVEAGGRSQPFQEIEIEFKSGDPAVLQVVVARLSELNLAPSRLSKGERGYRLLS